MVDSGPNLEPVAGFADKWERAADGHSWIFHIRDGMKWSDGEPATSADACFSWELGVDAIKAEKSLGAGYLEPTMQDAGVTAVACPDPSTLVATTDDPSDRVLQIAHPDHPQAHLGQGDVQDDREGQVHAAARRHGPVSGDRLADRPVHPPPAQRELLGNTGLRR